MRLTIDKKDMIIPEIQLKTGIISICFKELSHQVNEFRTILEWDGLLGKTGYFLKISKV